MNRCRIRIVNDVTDRVTVVETDRDGMEVFREIALIVKRMNRQKDSPLSGSLSTTTDELVLHVHCARVLWDKNFTASIIATADPIREIERAIWQIGGVA